MTDQEINEEIAEACGWKIPDGFVNYVIDPSGKTRFFHPMMEPAPLPDYCNDLNAMHEAENTLSFKTKIDEYYIHLCSTSGAMPCYATARQRAEAFLRTLNKWKD